MRKRSLTVIVLLVTTGAVALYAWPVPGLAGVAGGIAVSAEPTPPPAQAPAPGEDRVLVQVDARSEPGLERQAVGSEPAPGALQLDSGCAELAEDWAALQEHVADLERQLELWENHPEGSPWGAFLHSDEAEFITDPGLRTELKYILLDDVPVYLKPGEATWIANRLEADDWFLFYGPDAGIEDGILQLVGPERAYRDIPHEKLRRLLIAETFEAEWLALFREYERARE